jgi:hypothetical protein
MRRSSKIALALSVGLAAALAVTAYALAASSFSVRIDKTANLATGGKGLTATGRFTCPSGSLVRMVAIAVQPKTGAFAQGIYPTSGTRVTCTGGEARWTMNLGGSAKKGKKPSGLASFKRGSAKVCTLAFTTAQRVGFTGLVNACQTVKVS